MFDRKNKGMLNKSLQQLNHQCTVLKILTLDIKNPNHKAGQHILDKELIGKKKKRKGKKFSALLFVFQQLNVFLSEVKWKLLQPTNWI